MPYNDIPKLIKQFIEVFGTDDKNFSVEERRMADDLRKAGSVKSGKIPNSHIFNMKRKLRKLIQMRVHHSNVKETVEEDVTPDDLKEENLVVDFKNNRSIAGTKLGEKTITIPLSLYNALCAHFVNQLSRTNQILKVLEDHEHFQVPAGKPDNS